MNPDLIIFDCDGVLVNSEPIASRIFHELVSEIGLSIALERISIPTCLASSGPYAKIRLSLGVTQLLPIFEGRIFSAVEVSRGKPFPDLFLYAAEKMGVPSKNCIVVEDSVFGVQAGIAAGMVVLGYAERTDPEVLRHNGATVFDDMLELPELINSL